MHVLLITVPFSRCFLSINDRLWRQIPECKGRASLLAHLWCVSVAPLPAAVGKLAAASYTLLQQTDGSYQRAPTNRPQSAPESFLLFHELYWSCASALMIASSFAFAGSTSGM